jgi:membrane protein
MNRTLADLLHMLGYRLGEQFLLTSSKGTVRDIYQHVYEFIRLGGDQIFSLIREAANEWIDDKAPRLGASLAYYTLLSLAPLLVVVVAVAAIAYGKTAVEGQLYWQTQWLLGHEGAGVVQGLLKNANHLGTGIVSTILGLITLLFGASSVVVELSDALNTIWHVTPPPCAPGFQSVVQFFKDRIYSIAMILGTGFILLVSLVLNTLVSALGSFFSGILPVPEAVLHVTEFIFAFCVTTLLFAAIYKVLPSVRLKWSDVFIGATFTSLLFTVGKQIIGIYLGKESFASTYGAAGSLVVVLVWVYYSAQLFFMGAEFTKVYTKRFGSQKKTAAPAYQPPPKAL